MKWETFWEFFIGFVLKYIPYGSYHNIILEIPELHHADQKVRGLTSLELKEWLIFPDCHMFSY